MGKKKGKGKKKSSLSSLERKTFQFLIEDRKNKIEWRKAMCELIKEDIQLYQEAYELQKQDKSNSTALLEESIRNQCLISAKIREAIPEAEIQKKGSEVAKVRQIANSILEMNKVQIKNTEELKSLQEKVSTIESYDVQKGGQQISEIEQLNVDDSGKIDKKTKWEERQKNDFKIEMLKIFNNKAVAYQEKTFNKLDRNIEKIAEETRWLKSSADILNSMENSLEHTNSSIVAMMNIEKENLEQRKDLSLQTSVIVEEQKREIARIEKDFLKLKQEELMEIKLLSDQKWLVSNRERTKQDLQELKEKLLACKSFLRYNEYHIQDLEQQVSSENQLNDELKKVIEEAKMIIAKEVTYPLTQPLTGAHKQMNILISLESLFNKVANLIMKTKNKCNNQRQI